MTTQSIIAAIIGQSNELGTGLTPSISMGQGCPLRDPVAPSGTTNRSAWPLFSDLMGAKGVWTEIWNSAVGSTSLAANWCGQIRLWTNNIAVPWATYLLSSDGGLWKSNNTVGLISTSTVQPLGTANTTGADGIPWVYLGVAATLGSQYVNQYVCVPTDSLWDPSGYVAAALNGVTSRVGFNQKWLFICIGQTDKTLVTTPTAFAQAYINIIDHALALGVNGVLVGLTIYGGTSSYAPVFSANMLPGYQSVLAHYASNPKVFAGPNFYTSLGVIPGPFTQGVLVSPGYLTVNASGYIYVANNSGTTSTFPTHTSGTVVEADGISWTCNGLWNATLQPTLKVDLVHGNDVVYAEMSQGWATAFRAALGVS